MRLILLNHELFWHQSENFDTDTITISAKCLCGWKRYKDVKRMEAIKAEVTEFSIASGLLTIAYDKHLKEDNDG